MKKFVIIPYTQETLDLVDFRKTGFSSRESLQINSSGDKTYLKYTGEQPAFFAQIPQRSQEYTHQEMLTILDSPEWQEG